MVLGRAVAEVPAAIAGGDAVGANAEGHARGAAQGRIELGENTGVGAPGAIDGDVGGTREQVARPGIEFHDVERFQPKPAVHIDSKLRPHRADPAFGQALHVVVARGHVGAFEASTGGRGREAILIGA